MTLQLPWPLMDDEASKADKISSTHPNLNPSNVLDSICQEEHIRKKTHFDILSSTNCDTKTLILLLAKTSKLQYLSFCSSNFKYEDRSGNLSIIESMMKNAF